MLNTRTLLKPKKNVLVCRTNICRKQESKKAARKQASKQASKASKQAS
jgi:hypothetical protein